MRCHHTHVRYYETAETSITFDIADGKVVDCGEGFPVPSRDYEVECLDCGRREVIGKRRRKVPAWAERALAIVSGRFEQSGTPPSSV